MMYKLPKTIYIPMPGIVQNIGLGDVVRAITNILHINPLGCRCKNRQRALNLLIVFTPLPKWRP